IVSERMIDPDVVEDPKEIYLATNARIAELEEAKRKAQDDRLAGAHVQVASDDAVIEPLLRQLEDAPDDRDTLAVLADAFTEREDVRGDLIATQLTIARRDEPRLQAGRDELRSRLSPPLPTHDIGNVVEWGVGFVAKLSLADRTSDRIALLGALWKHPSLRVLQHLIVSGQNATVALTKDGP